MNTMAVVLRIFIPTRDGNAAIFWRDELGFDPYPN